MVEGCPTDPPVYASFTCHNRDAMPRVSSGIAVMLLAACQATRGRHIDAGRCYRHVTLTAVADAGVSARRRGSQDSPLRRRGDGGLDGPARRRTDGGGLQGAHPRFARIPRRQRQLPVDQMFKRGPCTARCGPIDERRHDIALSDRYGSTGGGVAIPTSSPQSARHHMQRRSSPPVRDPRRRSS